MKVKISQASSMLATYIRSNLVPMLTGSPGCGKSQIVYQIAKEYNLKVIDIRLSQCDPTDLVGFPTIQGNKADYVPMKHFPIEGDEIPEGYSGWLMFLDEATSAPPAIQAAAYKLILDRMVGSHNLHKKVAMVCAGNLETDGAIVQPMSTALQSRLVHMELVVDVDEWISWATINKINHYITDFIKFKPSMLFTFKPTHSDNTYACPRTWEFANRLLGNMHKEASDRIALLSGALSEGVAREFVTFCKLYEELPKLEVILANPATIKMPEAPSVLFALSGSLSNNCTNKNVEKMMVFIKRLPPEFQVITMKELYRRNKEIQDNPIMVKYIEDVATKFF